MPTISKSKYQKIFELENQGFNITQIAKKLHASRNTVKGYLRGKPYKNSNAVYPVQQQPQVAQIIEVREVSGPTAVAVESAQPFQRQVDAPFKLPRETDDPYFPFSELTVGGETGIRDTKISTNSTETELGTTACST
jgi:hypothetical protein